MKTHFCILVFLVLLSSLAAQGQCTGSITLTSQAAVNAFPSTYPCTEISGDVSISGNDITNLDSLFSVIKIDGNLGITSNGQLNNLSGLHGLTSVGGRLEIRNNAQLSDIDGLSALASIGYWDVSSESLIISDNSALTSLQGLKLLTSVSGRLFIENNALLSNLDGLEAINFIGLSTIRIAELNINGNASLTNIDGLSAVHSIGGYYISSITISNNPLLLHVNGLSSLATIAGGLTGGLTIINNTSLTNVEGLSSLVGINNANRFITITNNPTLAKGCGLYPILHNYEMVCPNTGNCITSTITGNGAGFTKEEILAGGGCATTTASTQPTDLLISAVTGNTMKVSFTAATLVPAGYITLMRAYGSPYPEDAPVDGIAYQVGNTIGSSTLVVGVGNQTSFTVSSLIPNTSYYLNVFAYNTGYDYNTINPLAGNQQTGTEQTTPVSDPIVQPSNLLFSDVTNTSMTVSFTPPVPAPSGYLTLMKAFSSSFPDDVPMNGETFQVGNIVGSSTVVVGSGTASSFNIEYLIPGTHYYINVYSCLLSESGEPQYLAAIPLEGSQSTLSNLLSASASTPFPNPFTEEVTIPFTVKSESTFVRVVIYDQMGKKVADVVNQSFDSGYHELKWDRTDNYGSKVNQGLYRYNISMGESNHSARGTLIAK